MKNNVGSIDRGARIVVGCVVIAAGLYWQSAWGVVGAVPLVTGILGWCPAYLPFGFSSCTCQKEKE